MARAIDLDGVERSDSPLHLAFDRFSRPLRAFSTCKFARSTALALALTCGREAAAQPPARQILSGHVPTVTARLQPIRHLEGTNSLDLAIGLPFRDPVAAAAVLSQLYDPASTNYHRFLTLDRFTARFGATEADYQAVMAFAKANRLEVKATYPNRMVLDVEGSVSNVERALGVKMQIYKDPGAARDFFAPDREPSLELSTPVLHISGLDNLALPRPLLVRKTALTKLSATTPALGSGPGGGYIGYDYRSAYVPGVTLTGTGQTVGLLEFESGFFQSDITTYESLAGLPNVTVTPILLDGYAGGPGSANSEVSLDIEMAISMAPGLSSVRVYEGNLADDILSRMASETTVKQFSASWNYPIDSESDALWQEMAMQGQSFFNASGDADAYPGSVASPSDDTNITVVGGTTLSTSAPGGAWTSEKVWNWGGGEGSSGGISTVNAIPPWQKGISMTANKGSTTARNLPDVALTGDNVYVISSNGVAGIYGGTSCATPLWAAFTALVNQQGGAYGLGTQGFINPAIYAIGKGPNYTRCFHDVQAGNNTWSGSLNLFYAVPGYDLCTGWGTPAGQTLINALAPDKLIISPVPALVASGPMGGPFAPPSTTLVLANTSASSLTWSCASLVPWITISTHSGTLSPGSTQTVTVSVVPAAANSLAPGVYSGDIEFTNNTDMVVQTVPNTLDITSPVTRGDYTAALLSYGPIGYWPLNESNSVPPADVIVNSGSLGFAGEGFGYDGVQQGLAGVVSNCAAFSNSNLVVAYLGSHIDVAFNPILNPSGPFTVEFWARPNQAPTDYFCPVSSLDDSENANNARYGWVFYMASGNQWVFRVGNVNGYVAALTGGTLQVGAWQHVAAVYNGSTVTLYVNGVAAAGPTSASGFSPNTNSSIPLRIGATSFGNRTFDGSVDEVAFYTNALSAATVLAHFNAGNTNKAGYGPQILASKPAGYWRLDEPFYTAPLPGSLPTAFNFGTLGYLANGVYQPGCLPGVTGVPETGFAIPNLACSFSGASYIDVPGGSFYLTGPLSVSAWVKVPSASGQTESIVSLGAGSVQLTLGAQGQAQFVDGAQSFGALQSSNSMADGLWHFLVGTYDGTSTESLFVDGRPAAVSTTASVQPLSNGNDLYFGNDADAGNLQFFNGVIDEVALFTNTLSANQVAWLYEAGSSATQLTASRPGHSSGVFTLSCPAVPSQMYELQCVTNLLQPNWITLAGPLTATNSTLTFTNTPGSAKDAFYRVVWLP